jgi:hypothetical protein
MSIKFVCTCGKRLKARDEMAGKRIPCPRCGSPVGVPSRDPDKPTPMTPAERLRHQARRPITLSHLDEAPALPIAEKAEHAVPSTQYAVPSTEDHIAETEHRVAHAEGRGPSTEYPVPSNQHSEPAIFPPTPASPSPAGLPTPRPLDPTLVRLKKKRKPHHQFASRYDWPLERRWYHCLAYPFRAWPLILAMAGGLTILTAAVALVLPLVLRDVPLDAVSIPIGLISSLGPLAALGYICGFLDCVFASALAGESRYVRWPGRSLLLVYRSLLAWLFAFLSAPAPLAAIGFYYWLYCGDMQLVDWIILVELGIVGSGYWLLAVLAVTRSERLRDANPWRVTELAERLGWRSLIAAAMAGMVFLAHGLLAFWTASVLHDQLALGLVLAAGCWLSWLYWATFLFRAVGIWCYYRRV